MVNHIKSFVLFAVLYSLIAIFAETGNYKLWLFEPCFMIWTTMLFLGLKARNQIQLAAYVVFPAFIFDQVSYQFNTIAYYGSYEVKDLQEYPFTNISAIFMLMIYTFVLIYEQKSKGKGHMTTMLLGRLKNMKKNQPSLAQDIDVNKKLFQKLFWPCLRFIALITALDAGLKILSIPNMIFLILAFRLLYSSSDDKRYWKTLLFVNIMLIYLLYLVSSYQKYLLIVHIELSSLFGLYAGDPDTSLDRMYSYVRSFCFVGVIWMGIQKGVFDEINESTSASKASNNPVEKEEEKEKEQKKDEENPYLKDSIEDSKYLNPKSGNQVASSFIPPGENANENLGKSENIKLQASSNLNSISPTSKVPLIKSFSTLLNPRNELRRDSNSSLNAQDLNKKKTHKLFRILQYLEIGSKFVSTIFIQYSIWIFHSVILTLLFSTDLNILLLLFFPVEIVLFSLQLRQWWHSRAKYSNILRSYSLLFWVVLANAFFSYLFFFLRLSCIRHRWEALMHSLGLPPKVSHLLNEKGKTNLDGLWGDFWQKTVILILAFATRYALETKAAEEKLEEGKETSSQEAEGEENKERTDTFRSDKDAPTENGQAESKKKKEDDLGQSRRTILFTSALLVLKGSTFALMGYHVTTNLCAYKLILMAIPLIYFNTLILRISSSLSKFKIQEIISMSIEYFMKRFVHSVKMSNKRKEVEMKPPPVFINKSIDIMHNEIYYLQFLKRMEIDIVSLSNKFWPYFFYSLLVYSVMLFVLLVFTDLEIELSWIHFLFNAFGKEPTIAGRVALLNREQTSNQILMAFLNFEFLLTHYYYTLPDNIIEMSPQRMTLIIEVIYSKLKFYLSELSSESESDEEIVPSESDQDYFQKKDEFTHKIREFEQIDDEELRKYIKAKSVREKSLKIFTGVKFDEVSLIQEDEEIDQLVPKACRQTNVAQADFTPQAQETRYHQSTMFEVRPTSALQNLAVFNTQELDTLQKAREKPPDSDSENEESEDVEMKKKERLKNAQYAENLKLHIDLDEHTNSQIKVLFKEWNRAEGNQARIMKAMTSVLMRFVNIPLLYSLHEKTIFNLFFLIVNMFYILFFEQKSFEKKMRIFVPIFSVLIFLENFNLFLATSNLNFIPVQGQEKKLAHQSSSDKSLGMAFYRFFLMTFICAGFVTIIITAKRTFLKMFRISMNPSNIFFQYKASQRKIEIDFKKWKYCRFWFISWIVKVLYSNLSDVYTTGVIIFCLANFDNYYLIVLMFFLFVIMIFNRMKKQPSNLVERFRMENKFAKRFRLVVKTVVTLLFLLEFALQILDTISPEANNFKKEYSSNNLRSGRGSLAMIIFSVLIYDLLGAKDYILHKRIYCRISEITRKYTDMLYSQEINENKLFERVLLMITNERLQLQIDHYLSEGFTDYAHDLTYHKTDIKQKLRVNRYEYLAKHLPTWQVWKIWLVEKFNVSLARKINPFIDQDAIYLLSRAAEIDAGIIDCSQFNLLNYLSDDFQMLEDTFEKIHSFYTNLNQKRDLNAGSWTNEEFNIYRSAIKDFEQNYDSEDPLIKRKMSMTGTRTFEMSALNRPSYNSALYPDTPTPLIKKNKRLNKSKTGLQQASQMLFDFLKAPRNLRDNENFYTINNTAYFYVAPEKCTMIFHNIRADNLKGTRGYMEINIFKLLDMIKKLVQTQLEVLVSFFIILVLFFSGSIISFFIIGLIFFRVLIEENGAKKMWWEVINGLFILQFFLKIFVYGGYLQKSPNSLTWLYPFMVFLCGSCKTQFSLRVDAFCLILIMWLIQDMGKRLTNQPEATYILNPGVTIARVDSFY